MCIVPGGWSSWEEWTECSEYCGRGNRTRGRNCDNPTPKHGGVYCPDHNSELEDCIIKECPGKSVPLVPLNTSLVTRGLTRIELSINQLKPGNTQ